MKAKDADQASRLVSKVEELRKISCDLKGKLSDTTKITIESHCERDTVVWIATDLLKEAVISYANRLEVQAEKLGVEFP